MFSPRALSWRFTLVYLAFGISDEWTEYCVLAVDSGDGTPELQYESAVHLVLTHVRTGWGLVLPGYGVVTVFYVYGLSPAGGHVGRRSP